MKKTFFILLTVLVALTGCNKKKYIDYSEWYKPKDNADGREKMTVMSFNVLDEEDDGKGGAQPWKDRLPAIRLMLRSVNPAVWGGQEVEYRQKLDILDAMPEYECYAVNRDDGIDGPGKTNGEMCPLFWHRDSLALVTKGTFWLSDTPDVPSAFPGTKHWRICTWARFKKIETGSEFYFFNTHLDNSGEANRVLEMDLISQKIQEINADKIPALLVGDMNCLLTSSVFKNFNGIVMMDARTNAALGDNYKTFNDLGGKEASQIDFIFYSGFYSVPLFKTENSAWGGVQYISDHWPIYATLKFN